MQQLSTTQQEVQAIDKILSYLNNMQKQVQKLQITDNYKSIVTGFESASVEIGYLLQARDLNEFTQAINKLFTVWKEFFHLLADRYVQVSRCQTNEFHKNEINVSEIAGKVGRFGGVKVNQIIASSRNPMVQSANLPFISPRSTSDNFDKAQIQYQLDENQRCILQEVLKQSNKLNVQIVMKRYDPKIKLCLSQSTDTGLDIVDAMKTYRKDQHEERLNKIMEDNEANLIELQKILNSKPDYHSLIQSAADEKLKQIYKSINQKSSDLELLLLDTQKTQPEMVNNTLSDFITFIKGSYKEVQSETYKVLMKFVDNLLKKQKTQSEQKQNQLVPQSSSANFKQKSTKGAMQKKLDEQLDRFKVDLSLKTQEIERKTNEITELNNKIKSMEAQFAQIQLELEQAKMNEGKTESERTQLLYEKQKLDKQLSTYLNKQYQDEAVQVSDTQLQSTIKALQKENADLQSRISQLQAEIQKLSQRLLLEQKSLQTELVGEIPSSKIQSIRDLDLLGEEELISQQNYDRRISSSRQILRNDHPQFNKSASLYSNREIKSVKQMEKKVQNLRNSETSSPSKNSTPAQQLLIQRPQHRQSSIQEQEEEAFTQSVAPTPLIDKQFPSSRSIQKIGDITKNPIEIDLTQAGTVIESYRTASGRVIQTERTKSGKFSRVEQTPSGRRIQTEIVEMTQQQSRSSKRETQRSTTQKTTVRKSKKQRLDRNQTQGVTFDFVGEENSISQSKQSSHSNQQISPNQVIQQKGQKLTQPQSIMRQKSTPNLQPKHFQQIQRSSTTINQSGSLQQFQQQMQTRNTQNSDQSENQNDSNTNAQKIEQQISLTIKVNDDDQFTAVWKPKYINQDVQTDESLLQGLLSEILGKIELTKDQIKLINKNGQIIQTQNSQEILSNSSSVYNLKQKYTHSKTNDQIQQQVQSNRSLQKSSTQQQQEKQEQQDQKQEAQVQQNKQQTYFMNNQRVLKQSSKRDKNSTIQSIPTQKNDSIQQVPNQIEQEEILEMRLTTPEKPYDVEVKVIVQQENKGKPLEMVKIKDFKAEPLVQKLYHNISSQRTAGQKNVLDILKQYYKKGPHEMVTYSEFQEFYYKLVTQHKQCGSAIICPHLQRFIMRLGITCYQFTRRQILKPNLSEVQPFNQSEDQIMPTSSSRQSAPRMPKGKFQSSQYFMVN